MAKHSTGQSPKIDPATLYSYEQLRGFSISRETLAQFRNQGGSVHTLGRRRWVLGSDLIDFAKKRFPYT